MPVAVERIFHSTPHPPPPPLFIHREVFDIFDTTRIETIRQILLTAETRMLCIGATTTTRLIQSDEISLRSIGVFWNPTHVSEHARRTHTTVGRL